MANKLPCPNPTCTHEFSQAELQAASQLACPKCGFRMQGRAAAAPKPAPVVKPAPAPAAVKPAPTTKPTAKVQPTPTTAQPKPAAPLAQPITAPASAKVAQAMPITAPPKPAQAAPPENPFALDFTLPKPAAKPAAPAPKPVMEAPPSDNPFALDFTAPKPAAKPAPKPAAATPTSDNPFAVDVAPGKPPAAVASPPPAAAPVNSEEAVPDGAFFNPEVAADAGSLVRRASKRKKPFNWMRLAIITCAIGFAASVVITAVVSVLWLLLGTEGWGGLNAASADGAIYWYNLKGEKALKLVLPKDSWEVDKEIYSRFEATAAWKRRDDDLWFAVFVKDYGMQKPRDAEVLKVAVNKLEGHFGGDMELAAKPEPDKFNELPAQRLQFKGKAGAAIWLGECWMFFKDGLAYWVFIASPEWQKVADFEEEMPGKRVFVAVERRGWREQPWPTKTFQSDNGKFAMTAPEGVWERHDAKGEDQNGLLFLFGKYSAEKDNRKNAQLLVFTFEKKDDLKAAIVFARDYLEKKEDNENKNFKIVLADEMVKGQTEIGSIEDVGNRRGRVIDLKRLFDGEPKRYFLLAVINDADTAYGIMCECTWESRHIWRSDFMDILRTTKVK